MITVIIAAASIWGLVLWFFLHERLGPSARSWARSIDFRPTEPVRPEQLFGYLLGGNFALLLRDDFNQLPSALPSRRIHQLLQEHWRIETETDCERVIRSRIEGLGRLSPAEKRAIAAWMIDAPIDSSEYMALEDTCRFIALRARLAQVDALRHDHLSILAWDMQQLACLVRMACAVGWVTRASADEVLSMLKARARASFASWSDYSLCGLVGLGLRGSLDVFDRTEWTQFARSHSVFLDKRHTPTRHASRWGSVPSQHGRAQAGTAASFEPWRLAAH
jgi:hypothetical protein